MTKFEMITFRIASGLGVGISVFLLTFGKFFEAGVMAMLAMALHYQGELVKHTREVCPYKKE